jgi:hypothetical protein
MLEALLAGRSQLRSEQRPESGVGQRIDEKGDWPLHALVRRGASGEQVALFLQEQKVTPKQLERKNFREGVTALELAAHCGNSGAFDLLLSKGAVFNGYNSPLHIAVSANKLPMVKHIMGIFFKEDKRKKDILRHIHHPTDQSYLSVLPAELRAHLSQFVLPNLPNTLLSPDVNPLSVCFSVIESGALSVRQRQFSEITDTLVAFIQTQLPLRNDYLRRIGSLICSYASSSKAFNLIKRLYELVEGHIDLKSEEFASIMHHAVYSGNAGIVRFLAQKGARLDYILDGRTLLEEVKRWVYLSICGITGYPDGRVEMSEATPEQYAALAPILVGLGAPKGNVSLLANGELDLRAREMHGYKWGSSCSRYY